MDDRKSPAHVALLPRGRLGRNALWNLAGSLAPMAIGVVSIPPLMRALGTDRFGVLTLAWAIVGYAGLFDFGLGRALTKLVAERLGAEERAEIPALFWTSLLQMLILGVIGGTLLVLCSEPLLHGALRVPASMAGEMRPTLYIVAATVPVVTVTSGLRGFLEAFQSFAILNFLRGLIGISGFLGPLLTLPLGRTLPVAMLVLCSIRLLACLAHFWACQRVMPRERAGPKIEWSETGRLWRLSGWITVSNIVVPMMNLTDRLIIAAVTSLSVVAFYSTPYEMVTKLLVFPAAIAGVIFPAFSFFTGTHARSKEVYNASVESVIFSLFVTTFPVVLFSSNLLSLWLGNAFARESSQVLQLLAVAVMLNGLGYIPYSFLQGTGTASLVAKLHLIEFPLYVGLSYCLTSRYGIEGAAAAFLVRTGVDALALSLLAYRYLPGCPYPLRQVGFAIVASLAALALNWLPLALWTKIAVVAAILSANVAVSRPTVGRLRNLVMHSTA